MTDPARVPERAPVGGWRLATVREIRHTTPTGVVLRLEVADRVDHWPGQHYVVRLTADDGYRAQRSYSVASAPSDPLIELYVERIADGEVSPYLADILEVGDELDVRGPIGGWFVWTAETTAVGIAGGSGVVPLVAMLRHAGDLGRPERLRLGISSRTLVELPYADELASAGAMIALTREDVVGGRAAARIAAADLEPLIVPDATYFVCGSAAFAEAASMLLLDLDVSAEMVRVERFGPSG